MKRPDDSTPENWEDDPVWSLLRQAPRVEARPSFADDVVRAARLAQAEEPWWRRLRLPLALGTLGTAATAVVVALVEEIFWRSFLMRLVIDWEGRYWKQPFGKGSWLSFAVVTGAFTVAHAPVDYAGALIYGSLTYGLCVWSRNLGACVVMHAVANLLMGIYALAAGKAGLW